METIKAGCFLVNKKDKTIALVYRDKQKDFSFPKGHLENGETLEECAIRETAEETKRTAKIIEEFKPIVERYVTPKNEKCVCYMFVATDDGESDNTSEDTHETHWIKFEDVEEKLSYASLKDSWKKVKSNIAEILK